MKPEEAQAFAAEHGITYIETSAKTAEGVDEAFLNTANRIWERLVAGGLVRSTTYLGDRVKITDPSGKKPAGKSGCC